MVYKIKKSVALLGLDDDDRLFGQGIVFVVPDSSHARELGLDVLLGGGLEKVLARLNALGAAELARCSPLSPLQHTTTVTLCSVRLFSCLSLRWFSTERSVVRPFRDFPVSQVIAGQNHARTVALPQFSSCLSRDCFV